ncbi:hypothetical protein ACLB2K_024943 [Fragaria x ananassa]
MTRNAQDSFNTRLEYELGGTGTGTGVGYPLINDWSMGILYIKSPLKMCLEKNLGGLVVGSQETNFPAHRPVRKLVDIHPGYLAMVKDHRYHIGNVLLQAPEKGTMIRYMYS